MPDTTDGSPRLELEVRTERKVLVFNWFGSFTLAQIVQQVARFDDALRKHPMFNRLNDLSHADVSQLTSVHIEEMADEAELMDERTGSQPARIAIVAPQGVNFGLMRMFQTFGHQRSPIQNVFRSVEDANTWLDSD